MARLVGRSLVATFFIESQRIPALSAPVSFRFENATLRAMTFKKLQTLSLTASRYLISASLYLPVPRTLHA
jgi:hypothetical protein